MSDSDQPKIEPANDSETSDDDLSVKNKMSRQTIESDPIGQETIESNLIGQHTIESDSNSHGSSNETDDSGNESQQQQGQHPGPFIQDLGPEDGVLGQPQAVLQEDQVEEPGEAWPEVDHPVGGPTVHQQQQDNDHEDDENVVIQHNVQQYYHQKILQYYLAPVYHGGVFKGDIIGSKAEVKDATIGAIGGIPQPPAISGPGKQAALAWPGKRSTQPALGEPEQQPAALPWYGEGGGSSAATSPRSTHEVTQSPTERSEHSNRRYITSGARPKTTDARFSSRLPETSEEQFASGSLSFTDSTKESDSESTLSSITSSYQKYNRSYKKSTSTRKAGRKYRKDLSMQTDCLVLESGIQTDQALKRNRMNQTDKEPIYDTESQTDKPDKRDRQLQTGEYNLDIDTQTSYDSKNRVPIPGITVTHVAMQTVFNNLSDNDTQTHILDQINTPTQTIIKNSQENEFQTDKTETTDNSSQTNAEITKFDFMETDTESIDVHLYSLLKLNRIYKGEENGIKLTPKYRSFRVLLKLVWRYIYFRISTTGFEQNEEKNQQHSCLHEEFLSIDAEEIKSFVTKIKDVIKLGEEFISNNKLIHSVVAFYATFKLHQLSGKKDESVNGIWTCFERTGFVIEKLLDNEQTKDIAMNHVIPIMRELTESQCEIMGLSQSQFIDKLETKAKDFVTGKKFIPAIFATYIAAQLHKETNKGVDSISGILSSIEQLSLIMAEMIKQKQIKDIALYYVMSLVRGITDFLESSHGSNYGQFAEEMESKAKKFISEEKLIQTVISSYVAAKLYQLNHKGDESVIGIQQCVQQIRVIVNKVTKDEPMRKIVKDQLIPLMHEMLEFLQSIQSSSHKVRVENEAWCLWHIGLCYGSCKEYQESANMNESAIELMKTELKDQAQTYRIYGFCLNNAGVAYGLMGNIKKVVELYKMSLESYEKVKDWISYNEKEDCFKLARNNLKIAESKLRE